MYWNTEIFNIHSAFDFIREKLKQEQMPFSVLSIGAGDAEDADYLIEKGFMYEAIDSNVNLSNAYEVKKLSHFGKFQFSLGEFPELIPAHDSYSFSMCGNVLHFYELAKQEKIVSAMANLVSWQGYVLCWAVHPSSPIKPSCLRQAVSVGHMESLWRGFAVIASDVYYSEDGRQRISVFMGKKMKKEYKEKYEAGRAKLFSLQPPFYFDQSKSAHLRRFIRRKVLGLE